MNEFLKDYHLYDDLTRLNNKEYFHKEFQVNDIIEFFSGLVSSAEISRERKTIRMFLLNLQHCTDKCVFLVMKWLIIAHKIIDASKSEAILEMIANSLQDMNKPFMHNNYQEYCYKQLVKPYTQYLIKLCLYSSMRVRCSNQQNQEEIRSEMWYIQYNLLNFGAKEFIQPIKQFCGFFSQYYPFLNRFIELLKRDLKSLFREVKSGNQAKTSGNVTFLELSDIATHLDAIDSEKKENFFTEKREETFDDLNKSQILDFFQSAQKDFYHIKSTNHSNRQQYTLEQ